jgi:tRNA(Ile)-lysidine synthase
MATETAFDRRLETRSPRPIAVAVSGGADSLLTLIETVGWAQAHGRTVVALSVDHGLQAGSDGWTRQVGESAARLGCGFQALSWIGEKPATGLPAAARRARHTLLADAARAMSAKVIVTGHTGDDALENAALNLGALSEWSSSPVWPQGRGLCLLRPFLTQRRAAVRERLAGLDWTWVEDPANANLASARIAARHHIAGTGDLPEPPDQMEAASLARMAHFEGGALWLSRPGLRAASPEARRRVASAAAVSAGGGQKPPQGDRAERLAQRLAGRDAFIATLAGAKIHADSDGVVFVRDAGERTRGGLARVVLPGVWDGRYELSGAGEARALRGRTSRLPAEQRRKLAAIPAIARPCLPIIVHQDTVTCPVLAPVSNNDIQALVLGRFLTACGAYAHERDL